MTDEVLLNSGYKEIEVNDIVHPFAYQVFQKTIKDEKGKKYSIYACKYIIQGKADYEYDVFFSKKSSAFRIKMYGIQAPMTIEEIEEEIENIWKNNNFSYYEKEGE